MVPASPTGPAQHRKQPSVSSLPNICIPLQFADSSSPASTVKTLPDSPSASASAFPSTVRIAGLNSKASIGGPAFVGQVFSMCDLSGTGLMAVSTHYDIPFISKRTPEWIKKIFSTVTKRERNGPVFRFFMDLGDAVSYVKRLNIPSGVVGACRLDVAYEHFKEKPHLFQFVPNEKQVKAANQLLKRMPQNEGKRKVDGVPVFTSQNLDIAIATNEGIKWYTPYFFDKNMLDNILEESVDQHFHTLIQTRRMQRRRDVIDDSLGADVIEEMGDSLLEPPEVQEVLDEVGHPAIPLSVISKAAEIQLSYAVDRILLGNRWLRRATGIQPKFPYVVDSFERRTALSSQGASEKASSNVDNRITDVADNVDANHEQKIYPWFPFQNLFNHPWLQHKLNRGNASGRRIEGSSMEYVKQKLEPNHLLPKVTMVGISTGEGGQMNKGSLKKTMDDLMKELEQADEGNAIGNSSSMDDGYKIEERDPLFVGNVGDYYPGMSKTSSPRWVRGVNN